MTEAAKGARTTSHHVIDVGLECQVLVKLNTRVPHGGRTGDSSAHEIDSDGRKLFNVMSGSYDYISCVLATLTLGPFFAEPMG